MSWEQQRAAAAAQIALDSRRASAAARAEAEADSRALRGRHFVNPNDRATWKARRLESARARLAVAEAEIACEREYSARTQNRLYTARRDLELAQLHEARAASLAR